MEGSAGHVDVMIIGGGPTGLGAAFRLHQHNNKSWILLDAEKQPGGMAGSVRTHEGFRFDHGCKTFCSRYEYIDRLLKECYGDSLSKIQNKARDSYVYVRGRFVRYPLQNNLSGLPDPDKLACSLDLLSARISDMQTTNKRRMSLESANELQENSTKRDDVQPITAQDIDRISTKLDDQELVDDETSIKETLDNYLLRRWGESLCNVLFRPYIFKSFAYPTSKLSATWAEYKILPSNIGADIERILQDEQCDPGLDSESTMLYPRKDGLVSLWKTIVRKLPKDNVRFKSEITDLDIESRTVKTKDGLEIKYDSLISTMPLNSLLQLAGRNDLKESLIHSTLFIICLGMRGSSPHKDIAGCVYFPESDCVFHRACIFSSFDPDSVPDETERIATMRVAKPDDEHVGSGNSSGPYWSLMLEVSAGPLKSISEATIMDEAIRDACAVGLLRGNDEIVSLHMTEMTHGHPLPTLDSETKVDEALKWLQSKGIYSRGRFGSFKYHLGDLDHCFIQGVEAADNITIQAPERCVWKSPSNMDNKCGVKIPEPGFDVALPSDDPDEGINAGDVRNAITREPSFSTSSFASSTAPVSRDSSQHDGSAQPTDSE